MSPSQTPYPAEHVGFIGLGTMGLPMALNLLKAGFPVTVFNRTRAKAVPALDAGAQEAESPAAVAARSTIVITMLSDSPDVEQVVLGRNGVIDGVRPGSVLIEMSTIAPQTSRAIGAKLRQIDVGMLDAPVTGGPSGARSATLTIMVGGAVEIYERCLPVLHAMGRKVVHVGPLGSGHALKLCNQAIVGGTLLAIAEALTLAAAQGLESNLALEVWQSGSAASRTLSNVVDRLRGHEASPSFTIRLMEKDLRLALEAAAVAGLPLAGTAVARQALAAARALGLGDQGTPALIKAVAGGLAGVQAL